jgi:diaminohydroxyphosphoribosylaminopyrimidine deaminase/5-amino-6-(5-phosphoribosylamino)uracil reductase
MVEPPDARFMTRALALAEHGRGRTAPNPIVGAVLVAPDGTVVGQGAHLEAGGPHAEIHALDEAGPNARGATLYVTLEPCCHTGRTGPCVDRIVAAGVSRVVFATRDPNPQVSGQGAAFLRAKGVAVLEGVGEADARRQNAPFFTWVTEHRSFVILKMAVSADGFVGRPSGRVRLTGPAADAWLHRQRAEVDALIVGADTVLVDDPQLTARVAFRYRPLTRVVVDWRARVPETAAVYETGSAGPVIMVTSAEEASRHADRLEALGRRGVEVERIADRDVGGLVRRLAERGLVTALLEGGPRLAAAFAAADLIDRVQWVVTRAALTEGVPALTGALSELVLDRPPRVVTLDDDVLMEFDVHRINRSDRPA